MTLPSAKAVIYTELRLKGFGSCQNILFLTAGRSPLPKGIGGESVVIPSKSAIII